jgi:environmental stress-induced protein Ves
MGPMPAIHIPVSQHQFKPWKNGLGVSRIIASEPAGAGFDTMLWQVSGTEIGADCPFSELKGLDRLFMVTEGAGVDLTSTNDAGRTWTARVKLGQVPYAFRGGWKTACRLLDGPVKVFNIIARRGKARASVEYLNGTTLAKAEGEIAIAVHLGSLDAWMLSGPGAESISISPPPGPVALIKIAS